MAEESGRTLITPLIFNDEPVGRAETAYFQFEHYADTFARIIAARDTRTPLTIGVHGEWGSGKTTLMRRIQAKLDETRDWKTEAPSFVNVNERSSAFGKKCRWAMRGERNESALTSSGFAVQLALDRSCRHGLLQVQSNSNHRLCPTDGSALCSLPCAPRRRWRAERSGTRLCPGRIPVAGSSGR